MSSQTDAGRIASYESIVLNNYCIISASVFLLYEYLITVDREVTSFWIGKASGASVLFLSNRYLSLLVNVLGLIEFGQFSDASCASFARALAIMTLLNYVPWAAFSGLRAYALCKHKLLSSLVFALALMPVGINAARFSFDLTGTDDPIFGCFAEDSVPAALQLKFVVIARASLIASDALIIVATWWALPKNTISFKTFERTGLSLTSVLFRDGIIYFGILLILNVLHLTFSLRSMFGFNDNSASNITAFTENVTAVLVSRFLLNLQEANRATCALDSHGPLSTVAEGSSSSITFARVIGSIGSSIGPGLDAKTSSSGDDLSSYESFELHTQ